MQSVIVSTACEWPSLDLITARRCNGWQSASFATRVLRSVSEFPTLTVVPIVPGSPTSSAWRLSSMVRPAMSMFVPAVCVPVRLPARSKRPNRLEALRKQCFFFIQITAKTLVFLSLFRYNESYGRDSPSQKLWGCYFDKNNCPIPAHANPLSLNFCYTNSILPHQLQICLAQHPVDRACRTARQLEKFYLLWIARPDDLGNSVSARYNGGRHHPVEISFYEKENIAFCKKPHSVFICNGCAATVK